jgi:hypothetical protein
MSKRIDLPATPLSHSELFVRIDPNDVQPGDIFQGTRNPSKWYENENKGDVEDWREYFRRTPGSLESATPRPTDHDPKGAVSADGNDGGVIMTLTWTVSKAGIQRLADAVQDITNDD